MGVKESEQFGIEVVEPEKKEPMGLSPASLPDECDEATAYVGEGTYPGETIPIASSRALSLVNIADRGTCLSYENE